MEPHPCVQNPVPQAIQASGLAQHLDSTGNVEPKPATGSSHYETMPSSRHLDTMIGPYARCQGPARMARQFNDPSLESHQFSQIDSPALDQGSFPQNTALDLLRKAWPLRLANLQLPQGGPSSIPIQEQENSRLNPEIGASKRASALDTPLAVSQMNLVSSSQPGIPPTKYVSLPSPDTPSPRTRGETGSPSHKIQELENSCLHPEYSGVLGMLSKQSSYVSSAQYGILPTNDVSLPPPDVPSRRIVPRVVTSPPAHQPPAHEGTKLIPGLLDSQRKEFLDTDVVEEPVTTSVSPPDGFLVDVARNPLSRPPSPSPARQNGAVKPDGLGKSKKETRRKNTCPECHKSFGSLPKLRDHINIHTGNRPYVCQDCNARFKQNSALVQHKKTHSSDRPYCCSLCSGSFIREHEYLEHMISNVCGRSLQHERRNEDGEIECSTCGKRDFRDRQSFMKHSKHHDQGEAYVCPICNEYFGQKSLRRLVAHFKKEHPLALEALCKDLKN